jgi:aminopeptidase
MIDPRWQRLAEILVGYSTAVQPGERVLIAMIEGHTLSLARAVHREVVRAGGYPHIEFQSATLERDLLLHGSDEQVAWVPEMQTIGMDWADVYIALRGASNPRILEGVPVGRIAARRKALGIVSAHRTNNTRWTLIRVPDDSFAQAAGMSLDGMMEFFFHAVLRDWQWESERYAAIRDRLSGTRRVEVTGERTHLTFSTEGRTYEMEDGHINMPGGEVFTAPVEDSVEGELQFDFPGVFAGRYVEGIRLCFRNGRVTEATAKSNQDLLLQLLDMDEGSRTVGEFGIGLNPGVDRFCGDILYDEKIFGTVHIALGRSYFECGGQNNSALHWDIVKDMRTSGRLVIDGKPVIEDGRLLVT